MNKSLIKKFLMFFLIALTNSKYCGIVNLFEKNKLTQDSFISITQDLVEKNNGTAKTIFGWLKLDKNNFYYHPLLKLSFKQTKEQLQRESVLKNFALITYTNKKNEKSFLTFTFAKKKNKWESKKIFFEIPEETWFFISYGFDYKKKRVQLHVSYQIFGEEIFVTKSFETDYPEFFIKKTFELNIGCFPINNEGSRLTTKYCSEGESSDFNFSLEYFEDPRFLYLLDFNTQKNVNFNFDIYPKEKKQKIFSKNNIFFSLDIIGEKNYGTPILSYNKQLIQDSLVLKGKTEFLLKEINLIDKTKKVSSPTFYFNFKYQEPLPINLRILKVKNKVSNSLIYIYLKKVLNSNKRFLDIFIPGTNFRFTTSAIFEENKVQKFSISLIQEKNLFWIYINHPNEDNYSLKTNLNLLGNSEITFFYNAFLYAGFLKVNEINIIPSVAGIIYNKIQPIYNRCDQNCEIFSSLNIRNKKCYSCLKKDVFVPQRSDCEKFCPLGYKNIDGICNECFDKECSELQNQFFKIIKISPEEFLLEASVNVDLNGYDLKSLFKVAVLRAVPNKEFDYKVEYYKGDKLRKSLLYTFDYKKKDIGHQIVFELDPRKIVFSNLKNRIPIQISVFDRFDDKFDPKFENYKYEDYVNTVNNSLKDIKKKKFLHKKKLIVNIIKNLRKNLKAKFAKKDFTKNRLNLKNIFNKKKDLTDYNLKKNQFDIRKIFDNKKREIPFYLKKIQNQNNNLTQKKKPLRLNLSKFSQFINKNPIKKNKNFDLNKILKKKKDENKKKLNEAFKMYYFKLHKKLLIKTMKESLLKKIINNLELQNKNQKQELLTKFKKFYIKVHNDNLRKLLKEKIIKKVLELNLISEKKINENQRLKLKNLFSDYYRKLYIAKEKLRSENKVQRKLDKKLIKNEITNYYNEKKAKKPILIKKAETLKKNDFKEKLISLLKKLFMKILLRKLEEKKDLMNKNITHYNILLKKNKKSEKQMNNFLKSLNIRNEVLSRHLNLEKIKSKSLLEANLELKKKLKFRKKLKRKIRKNLRKKNRKKLEKLVNKILKKYNEKLNDKKKEIKNSNNTSNFVINNITHNNLNKKENQVNNLFKNKENNYLLNHHKIDYNNEISNNIGNKQKSKNNLTLPIENNLLIKNHEIKNNNFEKLQLPKNYLKNENIKNNTYEDNLLDSIEKKDVKKTYEEKILETMKKNPLPVIVKKEDDDILTEEDWEIKNLKQDVKKDEIKETTKINEIKKTDENEKQEDPNKITSIEFISNFVKNSKKNLQAVEKKEEEKPKKTNNIKELSEKLLEKVYNPIKTEESPLLINNKKAEENLNEKKEENLVKEKIPNLLLNEIKKEELIKDVNGKENLNLSTNELKKEKLVNPVVYNVKLDQIYETGDKIADRMGTCAYYIFIAGCIIGVFGSLFKFKNLKNDDFFFQKFIQKFLMAQFFAFILLINSQLPSSLNQFLFRFYHLFIGTNNIFGNYIKKSFENNSDLLLHYQEKIHNNFHNSNVYSHFFTNFALIIIIQVSLLIIYLIISITHGILKTQAKKNLTKNKSNLSLSKKIKFFRYLLHQFKNKILHTSILIFILQTTIFCTYNFLHSKYSHIYFKISVFIAFIYFTITICLLLTSLLHKKLPLIEEDEDFDYTTLQEKELFKIPRSCRFIYQGVDKCNSGKFYHFVHYLFYFVYGVVFVMLYNYPRALAVVLFVMAGAKTGYVIFIRPANRIFWKIEQCAVVLVFFLICSLIMVIIFDDFEGFLGTFERAVLGDIILYVIFLLICWNTFILFFQFGITIFKNRSAAKLKCYIDVSKSDGDIKCNTGSRKSLEDKISIRFKELEKEINDSITSDPEFLEDHKILKDDFVSGDLKKNSD